MYKFYNSSILLDKFCVWSAFLRYGKKYYHLNTIRLFTLAKISKAVQGLLILTLKPLWLPMFFSSPIHFNFIHFDAKLWSAWKHERWERKNNNLSAKHFVAAFYFSCWLRSNDDLNRKNKTDFWSFVVHIYRIKHFPSQCINQSKCIRRQQCCCKLN